MSLFELLQSGDTETLLDFCKKVPESKPLPPILLAFCGDEINVVFGGQFTDQTSKDVYAQAIKSFLKAKGADSYCLITEAWVKTLPKGSEVPTESISNDPEIKECILLTVGTPIKEIAHIFFIKRSNDGKIIELIKDVTLEGVSSGRFTSLLGKHTSH